MKITAVKDVYIYGTRRIVAGKKYHIFHIDHNSISVVNEHANLHYFNLTGQEYCMFKVFDNNEILMSVIRS